MSPPRNAPEAHDATHDADASPAEEQMARVLARIVDELEAVARRIDDNQAAIARAAPQNGPGPDAPRPAADPGYLMAMQDADLSAQRIAGVADFLRALASASPPEWRLDTKNATRTLKLNHLVNAIGQPKTQNNNTQNKNGDVELF